MQPLITWIGKYPFAPFLILSGLIVIVALWHRKKRIKDLKQFARDNRFRYFDLAKQAQVQNRSADSEHRGKGFKGWLERMSQFAAPPPFDWPSTELFDRGSKNPVKRYLERDEGRFNIYVFDHAYTTGSGKNRSTRSQTVFAFKHDEKNLPSFSLARETTLIKLISAVGYQDIDFEDSPEFSKKYILRAQDESGVRSFFSRSLRDKLAEQECKLRIECGGLWFIAYKTPRPVPRKHMRSSLEEAKKFYDLIIRA